MITTFIFQILIILMNLIFQILDTLLPVIDAETMNTLYSIVDQFFEIIELGINGFRFIAGPIPFMLGGVILLFYTFYYTVFLPIRFILRFVFKGN